MLFAVIALPAARIRSPGPRCRSTHPPENPPDSSNEPSVPKSPNPCASMLMDAPIPAPPSPFSAPPILIVPAGADSVSEPACPPPPPALTLMALPPARSIFPADASITEPPGLATLTPSYCCTTPATLIEPPVCSTRLPPEASPVVVRATRPDGNSMGVATVMLDPVMSKDPPRLEAAASAAGRVGASSDTVPAADNERVTSESVVIWDAVTDKLPAVLKPAVIEGAVFELALFATGAGAALRVSRALSASELNPLAGMRPPAMLISDALIASAPAPVPAPPAV